ncbi:flagellar protein FliT [bacterium]|nr:flagellar protein FliT [bacterium]
MQSRQQFEQLILQYNQLINGATDIRRMIEREDFDSAITMIKSREPIFLNCKCMQKFLTLTIKQEEELNTIIEELRTLELENIKILSEKMEDVKRALQTTQKNEKLQQAYDFDDGKTGSIINIEE